MARKSKQHDKQFKLDALKYVEEHPDLIIRSNFLSSSHRGFSRRSIQFCSMLQVS